LPLKPVVSEGGGIGDAAVRGLIILGVKSRGLLGNQRASVAGLGEWSHRCVVVRDRGRVGDDDGILWRWRGTAKPGGGVVGRASVKRYLVAEDVAVVHFMRREGEGRFGVALETAMVLRRYVLTRRRNRGERLKFAAENLIDSKGILHWHPRKMGGIAPIIQFTMAGVALRFECTKFLDGNCLRVTGSKDIHDLRVIDGRLGRRTIVR
jgi:hypothetical protein